MDLAGRLLVAVGCVAVVTVGDSTVEPVKGESNCSVVVLSDTGSTTANCENELGSACNVVCPFSVSMAVSTRRLSGILQVALPIRILPTDMI